MFIAQSQHNHSTIIAQNIFTKRKLNMEVEKENIRIRFFFTVPNFKNEKVKNH